MGRHVAHEIGHYPFHFVFVAEHFWQLDLALLSLLALLAILLQLQRLVAHSAVVVEILFEVGHHCLVP